MKPHLARCLPAMSLAALLALAPVPGHAEDKVMATVNGKAFVELIGELVFQPLGMSNTTILPLAANQLVQMANDNGGRDNVSVILVKVKGEYPVARGWWDRLLGWFK